MGLMERRLNCKELQAGETFPFPFCSVREFMIIPQDGQSEFEYNLNIYGQVVNQKNVTLNFGGGHDPIYSCPEDTNSGGNADSLSVSCVVGPIRIYYFN